VTGPIRDIGKNVLQSAFEEEAATAAAATATATATFCAHRILRGDFIRNIRITLCINYIILFINNNTVINNNLYKAPRFYFIFKILMGTRKDFFEVCRQFGHALSKTFASPDVVGPDTYTRSR
jgi:hypothetical protein